MFLLACAAADPVGLDAMHRESTVDEERIGGAEDVDPTDAVFDPTSIATIRLTMDPASWADVRDNPWAEAWYPATFSWDGEEVGGVAVRAFGAGSEIAGKPSLKISFDRLSAGQEWRGLDELKLDNSAQDVGYLNEFLATSIMRRFGVPAARTGWATVAVNGVAAGFFVVLESIDDRFVARWFGHDDGVLYGMTSGYWGQGLNPMSDGLAWFEPQTSVEGDGSDLVAISEVVATGSDEELAGVLDLTGFARESVARSVMGSMDAFSADGNNYYLYDDHGSWEVIPWDFDVDLGGYYFTEALAVDPRAPWLSSPWSYNAVTGADYEDPVLKRNLEMGIDVDVLIADLAGGAMRFSTVDADAAAAAALIRDAVHADVLGYGPSFEQRAMDVRLFVHARLAALTGGEVADCPPGEGVPLAELHPTGTVGWGSLLIDASNWGTGLTIAGEHACTGAFAHAPSQVRVTIPAGATRLVGRAGLQDWVQRCGDGVRFTIEQSGVTLWESGVLENYDPALPFDVAVAAGEVALVASENAEYTCDTAAWADVYAR